MLRLLALVALVPGILSGKKGAADSDDWGYREHNGPETWGQMCQIGLSQSPIDIRMKDVDYAILHRMHFVHYDHPGKVEVQNNGHSLSVSGFEKWDLKQPYIQGGGLKHKYKLIQFHLHWASHDHHGSEHKLGGLQYPAELHLVHLRQDLTLSQAVNRKDGLAVVGIFITVDHDGSSFSSLDKIMDQVVTPNNRTHLLGFRARPLLPQSTDSFFRYDGSLTTPPSCAESVVWTLLAEPISMTRSQITALRHLQANDFKPMGHNWRPVQPLNGRRILFRPNQFDRSLICPSSSSVYTILSLLVISLVSIF